MFPLRYLVPILVALLFGEFAAAQTVVNSTFLDHSSSPNHNTNYSDPNNWSPAEVPNNTEAKQYNVNIAIDSTVSVDIDAAISNLTFGPAESTGLGVFNRTFSVTGTTSVLSDSNAIYVWSNLNAPAKFSAGTLTNFSSNTLRGFYSLVSNGAAATLQFAGADVRSFRVGTLILQGPLAAIVDESGNDALRNFARLEGSASLLLTDHNLVTQAPFLNDGLIDISAVDLPTAFTAAVSLENFDPATRTMTGGIFRLTGGDSAGGLAELRFNGADIVNLASVIELHTPLARIADLAGNDGLRNLARILPGGSLTLDRHDFSTLGSFSNQGWLELWASTFTVTGSLNDFDLATGTISGGSYLLLNANLKFSGADIVHNGASLHIFGGSRITDLAGNDALRNFRNNLAGGSFSVGTVFNAPGDFTNGGTISTGRDSGEFRVPRGSAYTQTSGATANDGSLTADNINVLGGSFSGNGTIYGNLTVSNAVITPGGRIFGNLTLGSETRLHARIALNNNGDAWSEITGSASLAGKLAIDLDSPNPSSTDEFVFVRSTGPLTGTFSNAPHGARITTTDGSGSFVVLYEANKVKLTGFQASPEPLQLLNISTRAFLSRADDDPFGHRAVLIGGFILPGTESKKVVVRGIGPSLVKAGLSPTLADPTLALHGFDGATIATNDNWTEGQQNELTALGLAPDDPREAALIATLDPGHYTVVIREKNGLAGTGLVEVYDVAASIDSTVGNISTRGFTDAANVLIGGIIVGGDGPANAEIVVRALGPELRGHGIANALDDPTLELRDANGGVVGFNDDWFASHEQVPFEWHPYHSQESVIRASLPRGNYTAIVRAKANSGGVALVEFYDLRR